MSGGEMDVALLTPVGRGAVATIRVCGAITLLDGVATPLFRARNGRQLVKQELRRIAFGTWGADPVEEVVVCRLSSNELEIHCHGGDAAVQRILNDLQQAGAAVRPWQSPVFSGGDPFYAECLEALSQATTWRTTEILLQQTNGLLRAAIDSLVNSDSERLSRIDALLEWGNFGLHLTRPWNVVLTGRPNVGKSSLINRLLGYERAIVFDQPGTTRDVVTGETAFDGWPVLLCDTAGLRETTENLEAAGIARARRSLAEADLRLVLIDLGEEPTPEDTALCAEWPDAILLAHKCDRPDLWQSACPERALRVSSVTGEGVEELQRQLVERLVPHVPDLGTPMPITERQLTLLKQARTLLADQNEADFQRTINQLRSGLPVEERPTC